MSDISLIKTRIRAGVWEGILCGATAVPNIAVRHLEQMLKGVTVKPADGGDYTIFVPIPAQLLNDGVQTFVVQDAQTGATLASFTIITGRPLDDDLRSEIDLLRAELDLLKRAFRRHCVETN